MSGKLIRGVEIELGTGVYTVPPLNFQALEDLEEMIASLESKLTGGVPDKAARAGLITLITVSLKRNYPDITEAEVREKLDLGNMQAVFLAIMGVNAMVKPEPLTMSQAAPAADAQTGVSSTAR